MRCALFAYHDVGHACMTELLAMGADIRAVFTHEDDPREHIWFASVRELAEERNIPVFTPARLAGGEWESRIVGLNLDFIFSFHYRRLLPLPILQAARLGALNLHTSLLPKFRGRCPVNWVLVFGETETGVTLHYMEEKADTGDIVAQKRVPISDTDTAASLYAKMTVAAASLLNEAYPRLCDGTAPRIPQDASRATYFGGRKPADGLIDWGSCTRDVYNLVRAVTHPYPGAFTYFRGRQLFVWQARPTAATRRSDAASGTATLSGDRLIVATRDGELDLSRVQFDGDAEEDGVVWARRVGLQEGGTLG